MKEVLSEARVAFMLAIAEFDRDTYITDMTGDEVDAIVRKIVEAMLSQVMVCRENGRIVHEIRGAPDDIWKAMLSGALSQ